MLRYTVVKPTGRKQGSNASHGFRQDWNGAHDSTVSTFCCRASHVLHSVCTVVDTAAKLFQVLSEVQLMRMGSKKRINSKPEDPMNVPCVAMKAHTTHASLYAQCGRIKSIKGAAHCSTSLLFYCSYHADTSALLMLNGKFLKHKNEVMDLLRFC